MSEETKVAVINIRRELLATPHKRRAKKAITLIKEYVKKHFKGKDVIIDESLNRAIWDKGSERPPFKFAVEVEKDEEGRLIVKVPQKKA